ncbi:hypothetical protein V499_07426 [Pseudogymnoascus sp. VKM F-103]|nr:hypothetical protein V499_07426 [Pseudogymnoascus sp. VKM F-103]
MPMRNATVMPCNVRHVKHVPQTTLIVPRRATNQRHSKPSTTNGADSWGLAPPSRLNRSRERLNRPKESSNTCRESPTLIAESASPTILPSITRLTKQDLTRLPANAFPNNVHSLARQRAARPTRGPRTYFPATRPVSQSASQMVARNLRVGEHVGSTLAQRTTTCAEIRESTVASSSRSSASPPPPSALEAVEPGAGAS